MARAKQSLLPAASAEPSSSWSWPAIAGAGLAAGLGIGAGLFFGYRYRYMSGRRRRDLEAGGLQHCPESFVPDLDVGHGREGELFVSYDREPGSTAADVQRNILRAQAERASGSDSRAPPGLGRGPPKPEKGQAVLFCADEAGRPEDYRLGTVARVVERSQSLPVPALYEIEYKEKEDTRRVFVPVSRLRVAAAYSNDGPSAPPEGNAAAFEAGPAGGLEPEATYDQDLLYLHPGNLDPECYRYSKEENEAEWDNARKMNDDIWFDKRFPPTSKSLGTRGERDTEEYENWEDEKEYIRWVPLRRIMHRPPLWYDWGVEEQDLDLHRHPSSRKESSDAGGANLAATDQESKSESKSSEPAAILPVVTRQDCRQHADSRWPLHPEVWRDSLIVTKTGGRTCAYGASRAFLDPRIYLANLSDESEQMGKLRRSPTFLFSDENADASVTAVEAIEVSDIRQGLLGDCWFLSGMACAGNRMTNASKERMFDLSLERYGIYGVRFFVAGEPTWVYVDSWIPCYMERAVFLPEEFAPDEEPLQVSVSPLLESSVKDLDRRFLAVSFTTRASAARPPINERLMEGDLIDIEAQTADDGPWRTACQVRGVVVPPFPVPEGQQGKGTKKRGPEQKEESKGVREGKPEKDERSGRAGGKAKVVTETIVCRIVGKGTHVDPKTERWSDYGGSYSKLRVRFTKRKGRWTPVFALSCDKSEAWPMILEKAFAKLHGSYTAIEAGQLSDALSYLVGGMPFETAITKANTANVVEELKTFETQDFPKPTPPSSLVFEVQPADPPWPNLDETKWPELASYSVGLHDTLQLYSSSDINLLSHDHGVFHGKDGQKSEVRVKRIPGASKKGMEQRQSRSVFGAGEPHDGGVLPTYGTIKIMLRWERPSDCASFDANCIDYKLLSPDKRERRKLWIDLRKRFDSSDANSFSAPQWVPILLCIHWDESPPGDKSWYAIVGTHAMLRLAPRTVADEAEDVGATWWVLDGLQLPTTAWSQLESAGEQNKVIHDSLESFHLALAPLAALPRAVERPLKPFKVPAALDPQRVKPGDGELPYYRSPFEFGSTVTAGGTNPNLMLNLRVHLSNDAQKDLKRRRPRGYVVGFRGGPPKLRASSTASSLEERGTGASLHLVADPDISEKEVKRKLDAAASSASVIVRWDRPTITDIEHFKLERLSKGAKWTREHDVAEEEEEWPMARLEAVEMRHLRVIPSRNPGSVVTLQNVFEVWPLADQCEHLGQTLQSHVDDYRRSLGAMLAKCPLLMRSGSEMQQHFRCREATAIARERLARRTSSVDPKHARLEEVVEGALRQSEALIENMGDALKGVDDELINQSSQLIASRWKARRARIMKAEAKLLVDGQSGAHAAEYDKRRTSCLRHVAIQVTRVMKSFALQSRRINLLRALEIVKYRHTEFERTTTLLLTTMSMKWDARSARMEVVRRTTGPAAAAPCLRRGWILSFNEEKKTAMVEWAASQSDKKPSQQGKGEAVGPEEEVPIGRGGAFELEIAPASARDFSRVVGVGSKVTSDAAGRQDTADNMASNRGIVPGHAYSLLLVTISGVEDETAVSSAHSAPAGDILQSKVEDLQKRFEFVCLRNPWGQGEWQGELSDEDVFWTFPFNLKKDLIKEWEKEKKNKENNKDKTEEKKSEKAKKAKPPPTPRARNVWQRFLQLAEPSVLKLPEDDDEEEKVKVDDDEQDGEREDEAFLASEDAFAAALEKGVRSATQWLLAHDWVKNEDGEEAEAWRSARRGPGQIGNLFFMIPSSSKRSDMTAKELWNELMTEAEKAVAGESGIEERRRVFLEWFVRRLEDVGNQIYGFRRQRGDLLRRARSDNVKDDGIFCQRFADFLPMYGNFYSCLLNTSQARFDYHMLGATHGGKTELQTAEGGDEPPRIHVAQPHRITNSDFGNIAGRPWFRYPPVWARLKTGTTAGGHFWSKNRTAKDNPQFVVELERPTSLAISVSQLPKGKDWCVTEKKAVMAGRNGKSGGGGGGGHLGIEIAKVNRDLFHAMAVYVVKGGKRIRVLRSDAAVRNPAVARDGDLMMSSGAYFQARTRSCLRRDAHDLLPPGRYTIAVCTLEPDCEADIFVEVFANHVLAEPAIDGMAAPPARQPFQKENQWIRCIPY